MSTKILSKDKVPLGQKAAFGAGHLVLNLLPGALGVFMFFLLRRHSTSIPILNQYKWKIRPLF